MDIKNKFDDINIKHRHKTFNYVFNNFRYNWYSKIKRTKIIQLKLNKE